MAISVLNDPIAAQQALLAKDAEDMFDPHPDHWNPAGATVAAKGWNIVGYFTAANALLDGQTLGLGDRVYYGFLAQTAQQANKYVAVIRGTEQFVEWAENIEALPAPHPSGGRVEQGFYSIYGSMLYTPATQAAPNVGAGGDPKAAQGIVNALPAGASVTIIGHSLGSALGTYLMLDTVVAAAGRVAVSGSFFASPNTGNGDFVKQVEQAAPNYTLYNYWLDIVPRVPLRIPFDPLEIGYQPLPKARWISNNNRQARIKNDVFCNHHAYCYAAMLDYSVVPGMTGASCVIGKA
jgi:triacylglycerol lipase